MKLYKALKLRKKLINEINQIKSRINDNNSVVVGNTRAYNVAELIENLKVKKDTLIKLDTEIYKSNNNIVDKIKTIKELKDSIQLYKNVNTKEGLHQKSRYSDGDLIEYNAAINRLSFDNMISESEKEIERLQEDIDFFNFTTEIEFIEE